MSLAFVPLLFWASLRFNSIPFVAGIAVLLSLVPIFQLETNKLYFAGDGWMGFLFLMGFALTTLAGARSVQSSKQAGAVDLSVLNAPWIGLVFAALFSVGVAMYQWLMLGNQGIYTVEMPPGGRPFANLAQPNQLATLLLLGLVGVMFLWEAGKLHVSVAMAAALMLALGLVMTGSRSILLALAWLLPAYFFMRKRCNLRTSPTALTVVIAFYFIGSMGWPSVNDWLLLTSNTPTVIDRMAVPGIRSIYWSSMLDAIGREPWVGYGWGQIGVAQTATALDYPATKSFFDSAHNLFLDLALWNGVPIAMSVGAALIFWLFWQIRQCQNSLAWVLLVAVSIVLSHAMVEYPLYYAYFLLPVGLWMGALSACHPMAIDRFRWASSLRVVRGCIIAATVATLGLGLAVVVEYFPFEADWSLMRFQEQRIGNLARTEPPSAHILTHLHEFMVFSRTDIRPGMSAQELERMRRVSERYAYASSMYRYALAQALNNEPDGAQLTLRRLCKMQSDKACVAAKQDWEGLSRVRFPQLESVPFPSGVAEIG